MLEACCRFCIRWHVWSRRRGEEKCTNFKWEHSEMFQNWVWIVFKNSWCTNSWSCDCNQCNMQGIKLKWKHTEAFQSWAGITLKSCVQTCDHATAISTACKESVFHTGTCIQVRSAAKCLLESKRTYAWMFQNDAHSHLKRVQALCTVDDDKCAMVQIFSNIFNDCTSSS